jgi:hypothetical protein
VAEVIIPHFDLPFRYAPDRHVFPVQQDTEKDVMNCVTAACLTTRGTRYYVPWFGISDPTFRLMPLDVDSIENEIYESEPRAQLLMDQTLNALDLMVQLRVGVDVNE